MSVKNWGITLFGRFQIFPTFMLIFNPNIEKKHHHRRKSRAIAPFHFFDYFNIFGFYHKVTRTHFITSWHRWIRKIMGSSLIRWIRWIIKYHHLPLTSVKSAIITDWLTQWETNPTCGVVLDAENMIEMSLKDFEQKCGYIWSINKSKLAATDEIE